MSTTRLSPPKRGEIWIVDLNPTRGAEINKIRPAVVVSSDSIGILPVKLIAPITKWKESFSGIEWLVPISPDSTSGLTYESAVDALQVRGISVDRFVKKVGRTTASQIEEISTAMAIVVESQ